MTHAATVADSLAWALAHARAQMLTLVEDVPADVMRLQATADERHPAWILGHVLLADCYVLHLLTNEPLASEFSVLLERYGPTSTPDGVTPYDSRDHLVGRLRHTNAARVARVAAMTGDDLRAPMRDAFLARAQPTIGHHLHSLVFHEGYHAGQLSSWRKAHGFPAVPWQLGPRREAHPAATPPQF